MRKAYSGLDSHDVSKVRRREKLQRDRRDNGRKYSSFRKGNERRKGRGIGGNCEEL